MAKRAWLYIGTVIVAATIVSLLACMRVKASADAWSAFGIMVLMATIAQIWSARAPGNQSYHPSILFYFAGAISLPPALFVLLVLVPHLAEWVRERATNSPRLRHWYLQPFNVSAHILSGFAASMVVTWATASGITSLPMRTAVSGTMGALTYLVLNHLLVGQAIVLAKAVTWKETGILNLENMVNDFVMLCLGQITAYLYRINLWLILPALTPLALISRALLVPQLRKDATTDAKTGLLTPDRLVKALEEELARSKRHSRTFAVIMSDLDLLRNINNTYGHLAGDKVLAAVGRTIRESIREYDLAARFGGEEFLIVLPDIDMQQAEAYAERLRGLIAESEIPVKTSAAPLRVTLSLGVAMFPEEGTTVEGLIHEADLAVYLAKKLGRNRVVLSGNVADEEKLLCDPPEDRTKDLELSPFAPRAVRSMTKADHSATQPGEESPPPSERTVSASPETRDGQAPVEPVSIWAVHPAVVKALVASVIVLAAGIALCSLRGGSMGSLEAVLAFATLAAAAEILQVDVYGESTISVGGGINFAAALGAGLAGVVAVSGTIALVHYVRRRPAIHKTLYNWSVHLLAGVAPLVIFGAVQTPMDFAHLWFLLIPMVPSALAYYLIESGLITLAIGLSQGQDPRPLWKEHYSWLAGHYIVLCATGLFLALAYLAIGPWGLVVFSLPVLMMRIAQKQYVAKTEANVKELTRINAELIQAHEKVSATSEKLAFTNEQLFMTLAKIIDARDPYVSGHSLKVRDYASAVAQELGLDQKRVEDIEKAAMLHDIGKIGVSETILHKRGKLTDQEYEMIKAHTTIGGDFVATLAGLRHLAPFVQAHHERWDGKGYPDGLKGEQIPIEARVLAICDSVDAMASDRPYREAMPWHAIVEEIMRCAGSQFDPLMAKAFVRVVQREGMELIVNSAREVTPESITPAPNVDPRTAWFGSSEANVSAGS